MAEEIARTQQYEYKQTSGLVLQADRSQLPRRSNEPTGEPETLWGRLDPRKMGDRVMRQPPDHDASVALPKKSKKHPQNTRRGHASVLDAAEHFEGLAYRPRTQESRDAYDFILYFAHAVLADQSQDLIRSAVDEILAQLKSSALKDLDKKKEIEAILGEPLTSEKFTQLLNLSKKITDYQQVVDEQQAHADDGNAGRGMDEDMGVAVVFDEDEDEEDDDDESEPENVQTEDAAGMPRYGSVDPEDQSADEDEEELDEDEVLRAPKAKGSDKASERLSDAVMPHEVDAFWLQRTVSRYCTDSHASLAMANDIMKTLRDTDTVRDCENALVQLLNYDKFDLVKIIVKNKDVIYWCTRLATAGDNREERSIIEAEMSEKGLESILNALQSGPTGSSKLKERKEAVSTAMDIDKRAEKTMAQKISERTPKATIDIESLIFTEGGHFMSNKRCTLPEGSYKTPHKGYEEVTIPAPKPKPMAADESLVPIGALPEWAQAAFKGAKSLNRVQSKVYPTAFGTDENMLLCAPTGAGKTNVAMLTILNEMSKHRDPETGHIDLDAFKIVYIAPMKALVQEMVGNFTSRLKDAYGITVNELTGDRQMTKQQIAETQIIVTTPEKWDIITRKSTDKSYTQLVRLVIIDEIHLLHDDRGPVLESIVSRTIRTIEQTQEMTRLVGLSATLPNYMDVASFLRVDKNVGLFFFDNSYRPCPLQQNYIGITEKKILKRYQMMNEIAYEKCIAEAGKNQILVFVHSRKETAKTAKAIRDTAMEKETIGMFLRQDSASREILQSEAEESKSTDLQDLLPYGFAIHHAGMSRADRTMVEDLFAGGHIQVLVSTSTLAWGVNLPAHTVIIKGTQVYSPEKGRWIELSPQDVLQMLGRAGRPQYDTFGEGIIITTHSELQYYLSLLNQQLPIESQFMARLADMLNAEAVLGTIRNRDEAAEWLGYTYLYVRMLRAPHLYGITAEEKAEDPYLEQKRIDLIHSAALLLDKCNLMKYDKKTGRFQVTDLGRIASHYYISHHSMATYNKHLKPSMSLMEIFRVFALSDEFKFIPVRSEEKMELQKLLERVPIPIKESVDEPTAKINVLLQAYISQLKLDGFALIADMVYVTQSAGRLLRAIFEICLRREWAQLARRALDLCKMVDKRMWLSMTPLRQFRGVNSDLLRRLERKDFPWERMYDLNPQELGELVRNPKAGKLLHKLVHQFPRLDVQAHVLPITRSVLKMDLTITPNFEYDLGEGDKAGAHNYGGELFWVVVEDCDCERILYVDQFVLKPRYAKEEHHMTFTVPMFDPMPPNYYISLISDRWLHAETKIPVSFKHLILPAKFPPHTELLDLQPLPITALRHEEFVDVYREKEWEYFNAVQTQCFNALYMTDENIFIGSPSGSGKTVCAEIAVFRAWLEAAQNDSVAGKIVYIAPMEELCHERFVNWKHRFSNLLGGKTIVKLTGETSADLKLLEQGDLIVSTPTHWDMMSRRWKQRRNVQNVGLFIVDEMHLIGANEGSTIEVIVSRMRYMASQLQKHVRILALSTSLGNARDIGEWMGCNGQNIYNFHPNVRPVPLEIHIQSFTINHFASLMLAMSRPVYAAIKQHCLTDSSGAKQAVVFVPNRKQCRLTAIDLITYSKADSSARKFLHLPGLVFGDDDILEQVEERVQKELKSVLPAVTESALRESLVYGIGYVHEAMSMADKRIVLRLYQQGVLQVLIASRDICWGLYDIDTGESVQCHLSVIMGTQYYEGKEHRYVDYSLAEVLQMCGKASDVGAEEGFGRAILMCPSQKKEFYKKFLYEGLPVESHLDHFLHDHFNAEVVTKTIENKQDAVDYLTWTYLYRRMAQNPNYYSMTGVTHRHLSDHLSDLVENTLSELAQSKCIAIEEDEVTVSPLNLGMIAAYYYVHYLTIEIFSMSLTSSTKLRGLLEIITSAVEYADLPIRHDEEKLLRRIYDRCPVKLNTAAKPDVKFSDPHNKTNILIQSHFSRLQLPVDLTADLNNLVLKQIVPLIYASVDVLSSNGYLSPAIAAMELCQMIVQALWADRESPLRQLPYFDTTRIEKAKKMGVETVFDLMEVEDDVRDAVLEGLPQSQVAEVANVVNRYPNIEVTFSLDSDESTSTDTSQDVKSITVQTESSVTVSIGLQREEDDDADTSQPIAPVPAPFFPIPKQETWWLVVGDPTSKHLHSIKRLTLQHAYQCQLEFNAPENPGEYRYKLYFMCDSWVGCDQEYEFVVRVEEGMDTSNE